MHPFAFGSAVPFRYRPPRSYTPKRALPPSLSLEQNDPSSCDVADPCITLITSPSDFSTQLSSAASATTLRFNSTSRTFQSTQRLCVLAVTANNSLASGLVRGTARRSCEEHLHDVTFLELPVDEFPGAGDIAKELGVVRLPTFISFRGGARTDHIDGREARRDEGFADFVQRNL